MIVRAISSTESSLVKMNLLEKVQKTRGSESVLGIDFCTKSEYTLSLPDGSRQFACSKQFLFFFAEGYQETVFLYDSQTGIIKPVAYDFSEFLRLIFSCGSGVNMARVAMHYENESGEASKGLAKLQEILGLTAIPDPAGYMRTVGLVIDCSRLR